MGGTDATLGVLPLEDGHRRTKDLTPLAFDCTQSGACDWLAELFRCSLPEAQTCWLRASLGLSFVGKIIHESHERS